MKSISLIGLASVAAFAFACSTSNTIHEHSSSSFSKVDSLTDTYLVLSDSVLNSWNRIVGNEIDKSRAVQEIITDLDHASLLTDELRESFAVRMEQLEKLRFTQESIGNPQSVEDYDLAFQSIVDDLSKLTKDKTNTLFGKLQENSMLNRLSYDKLAESFNEFIQENRTMLKDINASNELDTKPLFVKMK